MKKTKAEQIFITIMICGMIGIMFIVAGCSGSCFGFSAACESFDGGCAGGLGYGSDGCGSEDGCVTSFACVDKEVAGDDKSGDILVLSCIAAESGCGGETSGCVNGLFCGTCGDCGVFFGEIEEHEIDETTIGCFDGCMECGDTEGFWTALFATINYALGLQ